MDQKGTKDTKKISKRALIPLDVIKQLQTINATYEQQGIIISDHNNEELYNKIMLRYDFNKNNETCKMSDIVFDTVCFHTHPKECYEMFQTTRGWPSVYDLETFLSIEKIKVMLILSLEGVYVLVKKSSSTSHLAKGIWEKYNSRFKKVGAKVLSIEEYIVELNEYFGDAASVYLVKKEEKIKDFIISYV